MKVIYKSLTFLLFIGAFPFLANAQKVHAGFSAHEKFETAEVVRDSKFSSLPSYIQFRKSQQFDIDGLKQWMVANFKFVPGTGFELIREDLDNLGHVHYRYQQTLDGNPIEDAIWIAHTNMDKVYSVNGLIYEKIESPRSAGMTEEVALEKALAHIGADSYKWEFPGEEEHLKWESGDEDATYYPEGELVFVSRDYSFSAQDYALTYKFNIYAQAPISRSEIYVDANSGEIIRKNDLICHVDEPGVAHTAYSGEKEIVADSFGGEYRLRDGSRGDGVRTFDLNESTFHGDAVDFIDDDNDWNNINPQQDEYATDAHWGCEMTYDYYFEEHGRNSIDNDGFQLNSYVHYGSGFDNAFWDGSRMTYGDGNVVFTPLQALDVAGHEVTHGLTTFTANLVYAMESGALNESFSDIFGTAIEFFAKPEDSNWLLGEDCGLFGPLRSLSNPNAEGDPDTYFGDFWADLDGGDSGGVHTNSGVQNYWYYLLTEGGAGTNDNGDDYDVTGIGIEASSAIAFRNLTVYLVPSSQFEDARFYAIQSAIDLFGECTIEVAETGNAWYAVGVGDEYNPIAVAEFYTPDTSGCEIPHEVTFVNTSESATDYSWDFGDGETSDEENPVHTYTEEGVYTVTLSVTGGDCGDDELVLVDYITVNPDADCIEIMPEDGTGDILTTCTGILFDSGGPGADYGAEQDAEITISPDGAITVDLSFPTFDIEDGPDISCDYDYLEIYDGPNTLSPLIGRYCNDNLPTDMTSSGPSVTIVFHSDEFVQEAGFEIYWSCNTPEVEPEADFASNADGYSCNGTVHFVDLSTNLPIEWFWDFGDGETSTEQNPSHTYDAAGTYDVSLTATNVIGSDEHVETDYVTVEFIDEPTTTDDNFCQEQSATLAADGSDILEWFDEASGGTIVNTGDAFITPVLEETTTYYVSNRRSSSSEYVGAEDNTFGGGGFFLGDQHLVFNAELPFVLKSVDVYADGNGERSIQLRDNEGEIIETKVVFIPDGESTVILDLQVPAGTNLQLGTASGSLPNLFRNNTGTPDYPYSLPGSVEILSSSAGSDFYYFFYNWQVLEYDCISDRVPVTANFVDCLGIDEESETAISIYPNPTNGMVTISTGDISQGTISISNVLGQPIATIPFNTNVLTIDLAKYEARGTYFVSFFDENDDLITIKRVVKK